MCACTLLVAAPLASALLATTLSPYKGVYVLGIPATNTTVAGLPFVILLPPTVAVIPTFPATVLVKVITALPKASVVTVALPTIVPVPLAIANTTDWFATGFPLASVICACTLLVAMPLASAFLATTLSPFNGDEVLGIPATNTTVAGLPFVILLPPTVAVIPTFPATVLVKVITALPKASVVTVAL